MWDDLFICSDAFFVYGREHSLCWNEPCCLICTIHSGLTYFPICTSGGFIFSGFQLTGLTLAGFREAFRAEYIHSRLFTQDYRTFRSVPLLSEPGLIFAGVAMCCSVLQCLAVCQCSLVSSGQVHRSLDSEKLFVRSIFIRVYCTFIHVNWSFIHVNCAFIQVNCTFIRVNWSFIRVNCAFIQVNCTFIRVNWSFIRVNCAFIQVNCTFIRVNWSFIRVNCALIHVNCTFDSCTWM